MKQRNKKSQGFTLVELMIVVVILGILAVIAIPTFQKFIRRAKEAEAPVNIMAIARGARVYYDEVRRFPGYSGAYMPTTTPSSYCAATGHNKYPSNPAAWEREPWTSLRFNVSTDHYYWYRWISSGGGRSALFTVQAYADIACNGRYNYQYVVGRVDANSGQVRFSHIYKGTTTSIGSVAPTKGDGPRKIDGPIRPPNDGELPIRPPSKGDGEGPVRTPQPPREEGGDGFPKMLERVAR